MTPSTELNEYAGHIDYLRSLGAADIQHKHGPFVDHLVATAALLKAWGAREALVVAGLFHSTYGTVGFDSEIDIQREALVERIGAEAEHIVYRFCSSDRRFLHPLFCEQKSIRFRDRFTGEIDTPAQPVIRDYCELTAANELELALSNERFRIKHRAHLLRLFSGMRDSLSSAAWERASSVFAEVPN